MAPFPPLPSSASPRSHRVGVAFSDDKELRGCKRLRRPGWLAGLLIGLVLGAAITLSLPAQSWDPDRSYRELRVFSQVFHYIENNYVDSIDQEALVYGAVDGMVKTLDPFSVFLPPKEYQKLKEDTTGEFAGLGMEVGVEDGAIVVLAPLPDSPAQRAGLKSGDRIVAIAEQSTHGLSLEQAVALLRGPPQSVVTLTVDRKTWSKPRQVTLVRRALHMQSVDFRELNQGVGYVRIKAFSERTSRDVQQALDGSKGKGKVAKRRGLILDLRDNPGGLVDEAVRVADLFLRDGLIVSTQGRNPRHVERYLAHKLGTQPPYPVAILVNQGSASASEIVAGALQDNRRARIFGSQTYGKGSVQTIIELQDGSGLKLTVARYHTPSGRSIHKIGITPDQLIAQSDPVLELPLTENKNWTQHDPVLSAALTWLRQQGPIHKTGN